MTTCRTLSLVSCCVALLIAGANAWGDEAPYKQIQNIVYAEVDGVGLVLDVFTPNGNSNGLAIVDVASGAWHSDRGKIEDHRRARMFDIYCGRGYTVFAVRPGSITRFNLTEMAKHLKQGIVWVKGHAKEYQIDPARLGLTGASAGGHLASLVSVTADEKTAVKATAVFFPPTDLVEFRGPKIDANASAQQIEQVKRFVYSNGDSPASGSELAEKLKQVSPALLVTAKAPPFLIIHGDADPLVPLSQSEKLIAALKASGVSAELIVKKDGAHPWPTIHEEVKVMADWFDKQLAAH